MHHEAKVRARKGFTILYVGHAGHDEAVGTIAVAPDAIRLVERLDDLAGAAAGVGDPERVAVLAQTTLAQNEWSAVLEQTRQQFPSVWTASRNDLCFATTNRQEALTEIAQKADAVVVIGSANSSNTIALTKVAREAGCANVLRVDGPDELDLDAIGDARIVGVTAGASAPEELVDAVIARLAPSDGVDRVRVTDEDEYFPPPRELRELIPAARRGGRARARRRPDARPHEPRAVHRRSRPRRVARARRPQRVTYGGLATQKPNCCEAGRPRRTPVAPPRAGAR